MCRTYWSISDDFQPNTVALGWLARSYNQIRSSSRRSTEPLDMTRSHAYRTHSYTSLRDVIQSSQSANKQWNSHLCSFQSLPDVSNVHMKNPLLEKAAKAYMSTRKYTQYEQHSSSFSTSFSSLFNIFWSPFQTTNIVFHNFFGGTSAWFRQLYIKCWRWYPRHLRSRSWIGGVCGLHPNDDARNCWKNKQLLGGLVWWTVDQWWCVWWVFSEGGVRPLHLWCFGYRKVKVKGSGGRCNLWDEWIQIRWIIDMSEEVCDHEGGFNISGNCLVWHWRGRFRLSLVGVVYMDSSIETITS